MKRLNGWKGSLGPCWVEAWPVSVWYSPKRVSSWLSERDIRYVAFRLPTKLTEQFRHPVPLLTLFFLGVTAVSQIITLNRALKCADPTLVVPLFYAG